MHHNIRPASCILSRLTLPWPAVTLFPFLFSLLVVSSSLAQNEPEPPDTVKVQKVLLLLSNQIERVQTRLEALNKLPSSPSTNKQRAELLDQLDGLNRNFESLATQRSTDPFTEGRVKDLNWSDKLESLITPLLDAISDLTEKPRKIKILTSRIENLKAKLNYYETGRENITAIMEEVRKDLDPGQPDSKRLLVRLENLKSKYNPEMIRFQLEEAQRALDNEMEEGEPFIETATRSVKNFFKYRGLNLLITTIVFVVLWYVLIKLRVFIVGEKSLLSFEPWMQKVLMTAYTGLVLVLCVASSLVSLYLLNDWLLLSIVILFLLAVVWASRQFIPRMFQEMRLALNLGTVKENERLIWKGVPWRVDSIGLQAALINPSLEGGSVLLPVGELVGQHSRPVVESEPWFPTEVGDWVILADGTYGRIKNQTMEQVVLELKGGTQNFYTTTDYLARTPKNISRGFRYDIVFGLDYEVQPRVCDELPALFRDGLRNHLKDRFQNTPPDFTHLEVTFDSAGSSALNLRIVVHVAGRCAEYHDEIQREIQTALVRICNQHNLRIPFTQLTVTLANELPPGTGGVPSLNPEPPASV